MLQLQPRKLDTYAFIFIHLKDFSDFLFNFILTLGLVCYLEFEYLDIFQASL